MKKVNVMPAGAHSFSKCPYTQAGYTSKKQRGSDEKK
jgi:hypothetical protein